MRIRHIPLMLAALSLAFGCAATTTKVEQPAAAKPVTVVKEAKMKTVVKGKVLGVSKKAKTITIKGKKGSVMIKFNDQTKGMEYAKKGAAAIINFKKSGKDKIATVIKPKLAKLPKGVTEIQVAELVKLVAMGPKKGNYFLVDSRPASRYAAAHIPTAVSIPVGKLKEEGASLLPQNKTDIQLMFYCGGPT